MAYRLPDGEDWQTVHGMERVNGNWVGSSLMSRYERAESVGLVERQPGTNTYGKTLFRITPFGRAWVRLYEMKTFRSHAPTAGEVATLRKELRQVATARTPQDTAKEGG
jgi:hypothetical protein